MTLAGKASARALEPVHNANEGEARPSGHPDGERASCARCRGPVPLAASSGRPRCGARFCCSRCRLAAVNERRAEARVAVLAALAELALVRVRAQADHLARLAELAEVEARIRRALSTLGLNPQRPRAKRGRSP